MKLETINTAMKREFINLNILVATRNRPIELKRLLESLQKQSNNNFSITIIDASDKEVNAVNTVVNKFNHMDISFYHTTKRGSCTQRNLGLSLINDNEIILISDDDCIFECNVIEEINKFIQVNSKLAAFSLNVFENRSRLYRHVSMIKHCFGISNHGPDYIVKKNGINVIGDKSRPNLKIEWLPSTALVIVKPNIYDKSLLGFNEDLEKLSGYAFAEDLYFTYNLYLNGYKLGIAKEAKVYHLPSQEARDNERLIYNVRTYNRFLIWKKLIYNRNKSAIYPFIISNFFFLLQYAIALFKLNPNPILGHIDGLVLAYKQLRN